MLELGVVVLLLEKGGTYSNGGGGTTELSAMAKSQLKTLMNKHKTKTGDSCLSQFFSDFGSWVKLLN